MQQNLYDDDEFFNKYLEYPRNTNDISGIQEWDSYSRFFPNMKGMKICDIGCGTGRFSRYAIQQGASHIIAYDLSRNMINKAKQLTSETDSKYIDYQIEDLETFSLPTKQFDMVFSCLTLHFLLDLDRIIANIYQSLETNGHFLFAVEHPIYTSSIKQPCFIELESNHLIWPVSDYQDEGSRKTNWVKGQVIKQHRKVETYVNTCLKHGFKIDGISEWGPTEKQLKERVDLKNENHRPMFLTISCIKQN
ncbi:hypothetical protein CYY_003914 [Polysphondylium violaceum]|uniref:Methyltransferase type 11 domain-containing protein n=1 Tax=Polysphondylium violaceum TaxID=133409 RepID=A0A8J4PVF7_9MYCE|nr:hypothetical protein CYY_003914 [Polysphondylium violaceum]